MFFFHHIGTTGSQRDFPKTVDKLVPISSFEHLIEDPKSNVPKLKSRFPSGFCQAWGVPKGAISVIRQMDDGDNVLLVAHTAGKGSVPVLCPNVCVLEGMNWELSRHFWGEQKYPLIFLFDGEELDLTWMEMCRDLGFKENYIPRYFQRIPDERIESFGGEAGYLSHLRENWGVGPSLFEDPTESDVIKLGPELSNETYSLNQQLKEIREEFLSQPSLHGNANRHIRETSGFARDGAFRLAVMRAYQWKCAICQVSLSAPNGVVALDAAHIFPKSLDGSDDVRNGLALCSRHHWAFDVGWFSLSDDWIVIAREDIPEDESYDFIREYRGVQLTLPSDIQYAPHPIFLHQHRLAHGFEARANAEDA